MNDMFRIASENRIAAGCYPVITSDEGGQLASLGCRHPAYHRCVQDLHILGTAEVRDQPGAPGCPVGVIDHGHPRPEPVEQPVAEQPDDLVFPGQEDHDDIARVGELLHGRISSSGIALLQTIFCEHVQR